MPDFLPDQYAFRHEYALFLNDILTGFVAHGETAGLFATTIDLRDESHAKTLASLPHEDKRDWLKANGYGPDLMEATYRHVLLALLSDFCHFVLEALSCSRKGKLAVAYSLLRKPLQGQSYLPRMGLLADPARNMHQIHFTNEGPEKLEEYRTKQALRLPIIEKSRGPHEQTKHVQRRSIYERATL